MESSQLSASYVHGATVKNQRCSAFVEYAYGKVPDKLKTTGLENKTTLILHYAHERQAIEAQADHAGHDAPALNGEGTRPLLTDAAE